MQEKQIYIVKAKLRFSDNKEETIPFYVDRDTIGKAEAMVEQWLLEGKSGYYFTDILSIRADHNIYLITD